MQMEVSEIFNTIISFVNVVLIIIGILLQINVCYVLIYQALADAKMEITPIK